MKKFKDEFFRKILNSTSFLVGYSDNSDFTTTQIFGLLTLKSTKGCVKITYYDPKDLKYALDLKEAVLLCFNRSFYDIEHVGTYYNEGSIVLLFKSNPDINIFLEDPIFLGSGYFFEPSELTSTIKYDIINQKTSWVYFLVLTWFSIHLAFNKLGTFLAIYILYLLTNVIWDVQSLCKAETYFKIYLKSIILASFTSPTLWVFYIILYLTKYNQDLSLLFGDYLVSLIIKAAYLGKLPRLNHTRLFTYSRTMEFVGLGWLSKDVRTFKYLTQLPVNLGRAFRNENITWTQYWIRT